LELADRAAELLTDLGVFGGRVDAPRGDAGRLGAEQQGGQVEDLLALEPGQDAVGGNGHVLRLDPRHPARTVQALQRSHGERARVDRDPLLTVVGAHREHDHVGQRGAEDRLGGAADRQAPVLTLAGQAGGQGERADRAAVGEPGQQFRARLDRLVGAQQGRAGQDGRQVRAGHDGLAEGLQSHGEFEQPGALPAELLRHVQTEQALVGEAGPELGTALVVGVERRAYDADGGVALCPATHRVGQRVVLLGQPDAHHNTPFAAASHRSSCGLP
jgi:hypothetical protein